MTTKTPLAPGRPWARSSSEHSSRPSPSAPRPPFFGPHVEEPSGDSSSSESWAKTRRSRSPQHASLPGGPQRCSFGRSARPAGGPRWPRARWGRVPASRCWCCSPRAFWQSFWIRLVPKISQRHQGKKYFLCKIPAEIQVIFCIAINVFHKQNEIWEAAPPVTHNRLKRVVPWSMCTLEGGKISPTKWLVWTDSSFYFVVLFSLNGSRVPWKILVFSGNWKISSWRKIK